MRNVDCGDGYLRKDQRDRDMRADLLDRVRESRVERRKGNWEEEARRAHMMDGWRKGWVGLRGRIGQSYGEEV